MKLINYSMKLISYILSLIVILIFVYCFTLCPKCLFASSSYNSENYLNGYWTSANDFAKVSDIDDMILNIDIENSSGFLIIIIDKEINDSDEFILKITKWNVHNLNPKFTEFEIEFVSDDEDFIWYDKKFKAVLSVNNGSLKLFHNDTLYADLFKDNKMTYLLN